MRHLINGIPAHMRHLQTLACSKKHFLVGKTDNVTGKYAQRRHITFIGMLEQHLLTHADAEKGFFLCGLQHGSSQPAGIQFGHAIGHRALTRKNDALGGGDDRRIGSHDYRLAARNVLQRLRHRAQIAHAVVDDGDTARGHSVPFVDGIKPAMRGSGVTAMRSARPKALKMVSA